MTAISGVGPYSATQFAGNALAGGPGGQLVLWTDSEKVTPFSPYCVEQLTRLETVYKHALKLVEKLRCCAQPNPQFRGERLVASNVQGNSERLLFVMALRDALVCFDNMKPLAEYMTEMANAVEEGERQQDVYLRRVVLFGVKPIKKFIDETYPNVKKEYAALVKLRDKYDDQREKLAKGENPEKVLRAKAAQQEFADKANLVANMFKEMPAHQMSLCKAVDDCARSEADFFSLTVKLVDAIKPPDSKKRWEG